MDIYHYYNYYRKNSDGKNSVYQVDYRSLEKFAQQLKVEITKIFPAIKYIFFNGHFSYYKVDISSDIDISIVLDHKRFANHSRDQLVELRKRYSNVYKRLHNKYGVKINRDFPGEITADNIIPDIVEGRGFELDAGNLALPPVTDSSYWLRDYEVDYRIWMSMLVFNNNKLIYGNKKQFLNTRVAIFTTIVKFCLLQLNLKDVSYLDLKEKVTRYIIDQGDPFLGVDKTLLPELYHDLSILYDLAMDSLIKKRYVYVRDGKLSVNIAKLTEWEESVVRRKKDNAYESRNIFPWKEYYYLLK